MSQEQKQEKIESLNPEKQDLQELEPEQKKKVKVSEENNQIKFENIEGVILDIEGTTTPISFVIDVLFPYARENMKQHIVDNIEESELQTDLKNLLEEGRKQNKIEFEGEIPQNKEDLLKEDSQFLSKILDFIYFLMDENQKITGLKNIQGRIWKKGYHNGEIKGVIYEDVKGMLEEWQKGGKNIFIYSSGSVQAQELLFEFSDKGNLRPFFSGHFDTKIGLKQDKESYENILKKIELKGENCVFLTDRYVEGIAADSCGINVVLSVRDGTEELPEDRKFKTTTSFENVKI